MHERCVNTSVFLYKYMKCHMYMKQGKIGNAICINMFMKHEYVLKHENELKYEHEHEHEKKNVMNTESDKDRL